MSRYWTLAEIREKLENDEDLEQEVFVSDDEVLAYINEGIDICEGKIHSLYEDYFLAKTSIDLVSGTDEYDLPDNIYAMKIRHVIYRNGSQVYKIKKGRSHKIEDYELMQVAGTQGTSAVYQYIILNSTPGSPQLQLYPPVGETGSFIKLYYLRNANRLVEDTDVCDIPEFVYYVIQYAKVEILGKDSGNPKFLDAKAKLDELEAEMITTLSDMIPDDDNEIEPDLSAYAEMS